MIHIGPDPCPSSVIFLPMIDLNPGDTNCVYSTLMFICEHVKRYRVVLIITFDQPLWWKSLEVIMSAPANSPLKLVILRLGGFHTLMSFLGSIGHIIEGSGLDYILEQVYAPNTVKHLLSGKAYSGAIRGHLLVSAALHTMLTCRAQKKPPNNQLLKVLCRQRRSFTDRRATHTDNQRDGYRPPNAVSHEC